MEYLISLAIHLVIIFLLVAAGRSPGMLYIRSDKTIMVSLASAQEFEKAGVRRPDPTKLPPPRWEQPPKPAEPKNEMTFRDKKRTVPKPTPVARSSQSETTDKSKTDKLKHAIEELRKDIASRPKPRPDNYGFGKEHGGRGGAGADLEGEDSEWGQKLKERITANFYVIDRRLAAETQTLSAAILIRVNADRSVRRLEVENSSGNDYFDRRCEFAVRKTAPFQEIPDDRLNEAMTDGIKIECSPTD